MSWKENAIVYWSADGNTWNKISDHNREPLSIGVNRIEQTVRTVSGTMRRYTIAKKRTFNLSWSRFPSKKNAGIGTVDGGWAGEDIENFHNNTDGDFLIRLRAGSDQGKGIADITEEYRVMIVSFSKDIEKRGVVDLWSLDITLEEV